MLLVSFDTPWKRQKNFSFLVFLEGIEREHDMKRVNELKF